MILKAEIKTFLLVLFGFISSPVSDNELLYANAERSGSLRRLTLTPNGRLSMLKIDLTSIVSLHRLHLGSLNHSELSCCVDTDPMWLVCLLTRWVPYSITVAASRMISKGNLCH